MARSEVVLFESQLLKCRCRLCVQLQLQFHQDLNLFNHDDNSTKNKRGVLPKHATNVMRSWLFQHIGVSVCVCVANLRLFNTLILENKTLSHSSLCCSTRIQQRTRRNRSPLRRTWRCCRSTTGEFRCQFGLFLDQITWDQTVRVINQVHYIIYLFCSWFY